jgi:hypothetical protein
VVVLLVALAGAAGPGAWNAARTSGALGDGSASASYIDTSVEDLLSRAQVQRLAESLEVYRAERLVYPKALADLVDVGLLSERDLRAPFEEPWGYEAREGSYRLIRPLF